MSGAVPPHTHNAFMACTRTTLLFLHIIYMRQNVGTLTDLVAYSTGGFGGLEVACWPLVPNFAVSNPTEAVGFFRAKKSSARLPSEGK